MCAPKIEIRIADPSYVALDVTTKRGKHFRVVVDVEGDSPDDVVVVYNGFEPADQQLYYRLDSETE